MTDKEKASFTLEPTTKMKLEQLKAKLRKAGVARSLASESAIVDSLIRRANFDDLLQDIDR